MEDGQQPLQREVQHGAGLRVFELVEHVAHGHSAHDFRGVKNLPLGVDAHLINGRDIRMLEAREPARFVEQSPRFLRRGGGGADDFDLHLAPEDHVLRRADHAAAVLVDGAADGVFAHGEGAKSDLLPAQCFLERRERGLHGVALRDRLVALLLARGHLLPVRGDRRVQLPEGVDALLQKGHAIQAEGFQGEIELRVGLFGILEQNLALLAEKIALAFLRLAQFLNLRQRLGALPGEAVALMRAERELLAEVLALMREFFQRAFALAHERLAFLGEEFDLFGPALPVAFEQRPGFVTFADHRAVLAVRRFETHPVRAFQRVEVRAEFIARGGRGATFGRERLDLPVVRGANVGRLGGAAVALPREVIPLGGE